MFSSLRSRLWLGYFLLSLVIIATMVIGLTVALARNPLLYKDQLQSLHSTHTLLTQALAQTVGTTDPITTIQSVLAKSPQSNPPRVLVLSSSKTLLFDSQANVQHGVVLRSLRGLRVVDSSSGFEFFRDTRWHLWIYVSSMMANGDLLVVATLRGNPSLALIISDPVARTTLRVFIVAMLLSLLLTYLLERWVSRPIYQIAENAQKIADGRPVKLKEEGPKEVRYLTIALNEMQQKVAESQQSQRDFVSNVSHELKTPLTSIQGFAQAIVDGTVVESSDVKHAAEVIQDESARMERLVADLLLLTRLEGGADRLNLTEVNLNTLVKNTLDRLKLTAATAQVKLVDECPRLPVCVTDPDRVTQVLNNLLDNAIKFSLVGSTVSVSGTSEAQQRIRLSVTDHGPGISPEEQKKIFERFYQVDRSRSKTGHSLGLGLPIARQIARNLGGELSVVSEMGKGSTFTLSLPIQDETTSKKNEKGK